MNPTVDSSMEPFRWGTPDLDSIRQYTNVKFGWDQLKCDTLLKPMMKIFECQAKEISRQMTLDNFVTIGKSSLLLPTTKRKIKSQRLARAMKKLKRGVGTAPEELNLSSEDTSDSDADKPKPPQKSRTPKQQRRRTLSSSSEADGDQTAAVNPSKSKSKPTRGKKSSQELKSQIETTAIRIPKKTEDIPVLQKTKEASEKELNKLKAIEVFKKKKGK